MTRNSVAPSIARALFIPLLGMLLITSVGWSAPTFEPIFNPTLETMKIPQSIKIDGNLDDAGWLSAGQATNFVERHPGDNIPPLVNTRVLITYDDHNLYVGFVCQDDPAQVRSTMCQRDQFDGDDAVAVLLDTYGEASWAYQFYVNPYGIQKDLMWTNVQGPDEGFDLIWHAAAIVTDSGYQVEMAIPFASMRFPDKEVQNWKVDFWRIHPRESYHQYSWSANNRDEQCWPCQRGTVEGIEGVKPGKGFEILPSFISNQEGRVVDPADPNTDFDNEGILGEVALGAKYSVSSDVTLEATGNPDFSQIEADAAQIDVNSTISLFFPERRPFFQEGSDLFRTLFNSFYTRMVNDPELAAKGTARWDRTSLAYMVARDENSFYSVPLEESGMTRILDRSTINVLRGLHQIGGGSNIGFMASHRDYDGGGYGSILAADGLIRFGRNYAIDGQFVWSLTEEPNVDERDESRMLADGKHTVTLDGEEYSGGAFITRFRRNARAWSFFLDYNQVDPDYRTQVGFDPWNNQRNASAWSGYTFYPESGLFTRIQPQIYIDRRWNYDGVQKWRHVNFQLGSNLRWAQTFIGTGVNAGKERWSGVAYDDLWTAYFDVDSRPASFLGYNLHVSYGPEVARMVGARGNQRNYRVSLDFKPIDRIRVEPSLQYIKSTDVDDGTLLYRQMIARARLRLQVNQQLSVRLVVQYNKSDVPFYEWVASMPEFGYDTYHMDFGRSWDVDPLITYRLNSFSVFYVGTTVDYNDFGVAFPDESYKMTSRKYFMKLQYLFQI